MFKIESIPQTLTLPHNSPALTGILRGVEREGLRIGDDGKIAQTRHPASLGSALTHPLITTDFSEALLEFITPPSHRVEDLFKNLSASHIFTQQNLNNEIIWSCSMPCVLNDDALIPVAQYGSSNSAKMKTAYRIGLGNRYGRAMQTVAGLHYNFSLPNAFWAHLHAQENSIESLQEFKDRKYFGLIRNFRRYYWLLIYLFGASPALCASFVRGREHNLEPFDGDNRSLHLPFATSLRMGDLGYQSAEQASLKVCYNSKHDYIQSLCKALNQPVESYEKIGLKDGNDEYKQLNTHLLQIENEFYSAIRPKRTAKKGETALTALCQRGVEYIEVRCLDINPFDPLGISKSQIHFLDTFLLYCALKDSPEASQQECEDVMHNQRDVVHKGRQPDLLLELPGAQGKQPLKEMAQDIIEGMQPVAQILDNANQTDNHAKSLAEFNAYISDSSLTPSAQVLSQMKKHKLPYAHFALQISQQHHANMSSRVITEEKRIQLEMLAKQSIDQQRAQEKDSSQPFNQYLKEYYQQYESCCKKHGEEFKQ